MQKQITTLLDSADSQEINNISPTNWQKVKLMEICALRSETIDPEKTPGSRYVGLEHIDTGKPYLTRWGEASEVKSSKFRFYPGDVLYGKLRPYLEKSVKIDFEGICSTDILVFRPNSSIDADFLSYLIHMRNFTNYAIQSTGGVNHPRTAWSSLANFDVSLPSLPEQHAIAYVLQTIQQAIQIRHKELELERERKAALIQHLFTHGTRNEPTKQSELGEIPESWEVVKLEKILDKQNKYSIVDGPFGSSIKQTDYLNSGVPIIRIRNISKDGQFIDGNFLYISEAKYRELSRSAVLPFDILVSIKGTIGNVCIYPGTHNKILLSTTGVCKISISKKEVDVRYVYYYMTTPSYQRQLEADSAASVQKCISLRTLKTSKIPLPPLSEQGQEEQNQIATILSSCDAKIAALEKEIILHEELFRTLLNELMTGRISTLPLVEQLEKGTSIYGQRAPDSTGAID